MRRLIISNFRVGSWYLHDEIVNGTPSHEGLGEISCDFYEDRTTKVNNWLTKTNDIVGKFHPIQWEGGNHRQVIEFADVIFYLQRENTLEQVVSYAISMTSEGPRPNSLASSRARTARLDGYEINDDLLNASYQRLKTQHDMIQDIYTEFPSKILTLETDCANNPYPNRYEYTGSLTPPENLWLNQ